MSLLTKPLHQISWEDVKAFSEQQIAESAILDYKEDFPKTLEKTFSAMANTLGGVVLIGIEEDSENKPILPIKGIRFDRGLSERVMNVILSNITPPFMPEVQPVVDSTGQRAVVVVRILQSHQTPHAIAANTEVYYRTGSQNQPEALASIDRIGWLIDGRKKSENLRESLYGHAEVRLRSLYEAALNEHGTGGEAIEGLVQGTLKISSCPHYPREKFKSPPEMMEVFLKSRVVNYWRDDTYFPIPSDTGKIRIVQDGLISQFSQAKGEPLMYYTELNCYGLYFYKQIIVQKDAKIGKFIYSNKIFARLDQFFDSAVKYYEQLGYWGELECQIHLDDIQGCIFYYGQNVRFSPRADCPDVNVGFSTTVNASSLRQEKPRLVLEAAQRLAHAFNWNLTAEVLDKYYLKEKGESVLFAKEE